ncbi:MAG: hypothetical protein ABFS42_02395 [Candidatus Krumholzibacteriota bacterium]
MKKMVLVLTLVAFALSGSAFAQDPTYFDNIGLEPNCGTIGEDTPFTTYVVLSKLTNDEVWGWEAKITYSNMMKLGETVYGDHVNAATRVDEFIVGYPAPMLATASEVVVAELQFMVSSFYNDVSQPSLAFIEGVYFSLIDPIQGPPAYLEASGSTGVELHPALGDPLGHDTWIPQLTYNGDCTGPVGVEESSFGSVKSLFR